MASQCCFCSLCALFSFAVLFIVVFFISVGISIGSRGKVHNILEDAHITNLTITDGPNGSSSLSMRIAFRIWSRNANKRMGVEVWHTRLAAALDLPEDKLYKAELGRAYVVPAFTLLPRQVKPHQQTTPIVVSGFKLSAAAAAALRARVAAASIPLRIYVKVRARYVNVDRSWQVKLVGRGDLHADDKCGGLHVSLASEPDDDDDGASHLLQGPRQCGWTAAYYDPDPGAY